MNELDTAIYTALTAGTVNAYNMSAGTAALPYVIYNQQAGGYLNEAQHDAVEYLYQMQCYSGVSLAAAWAQEAQVKALLKGKTLSVSGWTHVSTFRETDVPIMETLANGEHVYSVRAFYRFRLSK